MNCLRSLRNFYRSLFSSTTEAVGTSRYSYGPEMSVEGNAGDGAKNEDCLKKGAEMSEEGDRDGSLRKEEGESSGNNRDDSNGGQDLAEKSSSEKQPKNKGGLFSFLRSSSDYPKRGIV